jgi:cytochrome P450
VTALLEGPRRPTAPDGFHLARWGREPLALLREGAARGDVFTLRLWRRVVVGYRPDWNRAVLGDLDTFRSKGSLSGLTPYLSSGVVAADGEPHAASRKALNPHFHNRAVAAFTDRMREVVDRHLPTGEFDALTWSGEVVRGFLNDVLFGGAFDPRLLERFAEPLERSNPAGLIPRPRLFAAVNKAIRRIVADPPPGSMAAHLTDPSHPWPAHHEPVEELRVALAAAYDTTAHTLAFALWHLAEARDWLAHDLLPQALEEVQRLHPAGWVGSRVAARDSEPAGFPVAKGTMVFYSPWLTHHDPLLWPDPESFRPERFDAGKPAWAFIPFAAGARTCLGAPMARLMLRTALEPFDTRPPTRVGGDPTPVTGITLRPHGPLLLRS